MSEGEGKPKRIVSLDESRYIAQNFDGDALFVEGILGKVRRSNESLNNVIQEAIDNPTSPEQSTEWEKAGNFLKANVDKFGLKSENPSEEK
jgi:hypothetical protein